MTTNSKQDESQVLPEQGPWGVWNEEDGESWWQPEPANGHVTLKLTPDTFPSNQFSVGLQYIDPGCALRDHGHQCNDEILFVWEGEGTAYVNGEQFKVKPGSMVYVGRFVKHGFVNDGPGQLKIMWVITPPGLEGVIRGIGQPRDTDSKRPIDFDRPANVREILDIAKFARPEQLVGDGSGR